jgi:hypothetical protein
MKKLIFVAVILLAGIRWWAYQKPIDHPPGILIHSAPVQSAAENIDDILYKDFILKPLANYTIQARILSRRRYRFDPSSALSPIDFALGWQQMSDSAFINQLDIRQSGRFYSFRPRSGYTLPAPPEQLLLQSANTHIIPSDEFIAKKINRLRQGDLIEMRGYLVDITRSKDGFKWTSSLTRTDSGGGACEVMWVTELIHPIPI